jgi:WD40 repeat protein
VVQALLAIALAHPQLAFGPGETLLEGHTAAIRYLAYFPKGDRLVSASDAEVTVWDTKTKVRLKSWDIAGPAALSADGSRLAFADIDSLTVIDGGTFETVQTLDASADLGVAKSDIVIALALSKDGRRLIAGGVEDRIAVYTFGAAAKAIHLEHGPIECCSLSPDGSRVAVGSADGSVTIYSAESGKLLKEVAKLGKTVSCIAFSADGHLLAAGSEDGTAAVWGMDNSLKLSSSQAGIVFAVNFDPTGKLLAVASNAGDRKSDVTLLPIPAGDIPVAKRDTPIAKRGIPFWVFALTFSPGGHTLAVGDEGSSVRLWPLTP